MNENQHDFILIVLMIAAFAGAGSLVAGIVHVSDGERRAGWVLIAGGLLAVLACATLAYWLLGIEYPPTPQ